MGGMGGKGGLWSHHVSVKPFEYIFKIFTCFFFFKKNQKYYTETVVICSICSKIQIY